MTKSLTLENILERCGGTEPTEFNECPGLDPLSRRHGPSYFNGFEPKTPVQEALLKQALKLLEPHWTKKDHKDFRVALLRAYQEYGFTDEELLPYFRDLLP